MTIRTSVLPIKPAPRRPNANRPNQVSWNGKTKATAPPRKLHKFDTLPLKTLHTRTAVTVYRIITTAVAVALALGKSFGFSISAMTSNITIW